MTGDDIKQIAQNADQLIQIIQNIKGNVVGSEKNKVAVNSDINEPCFEEENEEDCTYELIAPESEREKKDPNNWW